MNPSRSPSTTRLRGRLAPSLATCLAALAPAACGPGSSTGIDAGAAVDMAVPPTLAPFPKGFLFGTATAPYQIEGGLHGSDWYQWESTPANARKQHADDGDQSYQRFADDTAIAAAMHTNAMRLGIDMSRLFPTKASFPASPDATAVAHYHAVFSSLKAAGITPMVTLYHWAQPTWLDDLTMQTDTSGWLSPDAPSTFAAFAAWAGKEYGGEVDLWVTLNEPVVDLAAGFINGSYPPLRSFTDTNGIATAELAGRNMIYAHAAAYDALHTADTVDADGDGKPALVSIAHHMRTFAGAQSDDPKVQAANDAAAARLHYISNTLFLDALTKGNLDYDLDEKLDGPNDKTADPALKNRLDWIGVNYYGNSLVTALSNAKLGPVLGLPREANLDTPNPKTEYGWDIVPAGFRAVLDEAKGYGLPIYVTENGIADGADMQRPRFLAEHLYVLEQAIQDGIDVRGYMHWSLIDNFEWGGGYCPRFGLAAVDYNDPQRKRTLRPSGDLYRKIIDARTVDPMLLVTLPPYGQPTVSCPGGG